MNINPIRKLRLLIATISATVFTLLGPARKLEPVFLDINNGFSIKSGIPTDLVTFRGVDEFKLKYDFETNTERESKLGSISHKSVEPYVLNPNGFLRTSYEEISEDGFELVLDIRPTMKIAIEDGTIITFKNIEIGFVLDEDSQGYKVYVRDSAKKRKAEWQLLSSVSTHGMLFLSAEELESVLDAKTGYGLRGVLNPIVALRIGKESGSKDLYVKSHSNVVYLDSEYEKSKSSQLLVSTSSDSETVVMQMQMNTK